ncbi:hypothetical protein D918_07509 [Trichuris suis]|nr:hypothetical protein D918_07509 [Trichuris suis]
MGKALKVSAVAEHAAFCSNVFYPRIYAMKTINVLEELRKALLIRHNSTYKRERYEKVKFSQTWSIYSVVALYHKCCKKHNSGTKKGARRNLQFWNPYRVASLKEKEE